MFAFSALACALRNFDLLLLVQKGGCSVYHGPIGKGSRNLLAYLERGGAKIAENENPAMAMLEVIGAGLRAGRRRGLGWQMNQVGGVSYCVAGN